MKTISTYLLISLALLGTVGCSNSEFKRTKSGLQYKIFSDGKGSPAKKGQFIKMQVVQKLRDSIQYSSYGGVPYYTRVDSTGPIYNPIEIFTMLRKGDSAVAVISVDSLAHKSGRELPPYLKRKDKIVISFKVLDIYGSQEEMLADRKLEADKEKDREVKAVEKYLADSNIHATKTEAGTYVVVQDPGNGPQVDTGKEVYVRYTGKLFPSGKVFESNMTGPGNAPLKFVIGRYGVIPGMEDGARQLHQGGKATLYIPAFLAYDAKPGPGQKPYEDLIFDIIVDSVKAAPPAPTPRPGMPGMPNIRPGTYPMRPGAPVPQPPKTTPHK
ncbi:MAG TPA: FKBP-type peptidyl-prolyl cis-trans isomerase [Puia sp.]|jgi:FKBP-type peptidyl-prolyl cis-trans isomerase|nr:FKBP-type peptidyl-prolyl cis-trans isomerase [Puia sp.]